MQDQVSVDDLLGLLGFAMVEIRAADSLKKAHVWADVFHNVPSAVRNDRSPHETVDRMLACAERHNKRSFFERYFAAYFAKQADI